MASLVLFRRRWHIASDVIPLVAFLLALQHLVWFCLYVAGEGAAHCRAPGEGAPQESASRACGSFHCAGTVSLERSGLDPDCNAKVVLRVANYR